MNLQNFHLEKESHSIALIGKGKYWDLHAYAKLKSVIYMPAKDQAELTWITAPVKNAWGDPKNGATGCTLRFSEIRLMRIARGNGTQEDECVSSVSQIDTRESVTVDPIEFRMRRVWQPKEEFGLLFIMQSGRTVEIQAQVAELIELGGIGQ